jgi:hypothetical protein
MSNYFVKTGAAVNRKLTKGQQIVFDHFSDLNLTIELKPHEFIKEIWNHVESIGNLDNSVRGQAFEAALSALFIREGLVPFYTQAQVQFVPNAIFDFLFWTTEFGPLAVSAKTSLRERYKQADLEAYALRSVHRRSQNSLITLDFKAAGRLKEKINDGEIYAVDEVVVADQAEMDELIQKFKRLNLIGAPILPTLKSANCVGIEYLAAENIFEID